MTRQNSRDPTDDDASTEQSNNTPGTVPDEATSDNRVSRRSVLRAASVAGITATTGLGAIAITTTPALAADASIQNPGELTAGDEVNIEPFEISYSDLDTASDITVTYSITGPVAETSQSHEIESASGSVTTNLATLTVPDDVSEEVTGATIEIVVSHGETSTTVTSNDFTISLDFSSAPTDIPSVHDGMETNADGAYIITNVHELQAVNHNKSAYYVLGNDIDASETESWNNENGFNPIGNNSLPYDDRFTGEFDGNGFEITGLTIDRGDTVGLFGSSEGVIKNVGLVDNNVTGDETVGGLVGDNQGGSVSNSYATGSVTGYAYVGGLVGNQASGSNISNSYATGSVTSEYSTGGLIGIGDGVSGSYTTGPSATGGTGLNTSEMQGDAAASNMTAFDFENTWTTVEGDYPELRNGS